MFDSIGVVCVVQKFISFDSSFSTGAGDKIGEGGRSQNEITKLRAMFHLHSQIAHETRKIGRRVLLKGRSMVESRMRESV